MNNDNQHIPSGYKPSPLGPIPEDWEVKRLGDLCFDIFSGSNKTRIDSGKYTVYGSTGVIGKTDEYKYEGERILVARVGAHAGQVSIASGKYDVSDNTIIVENQDCYSLYFAYQYLISSNLNKMVFGSGQPLITAGMLKRMFVVYPPFEEQLKINNVLQLWDTAIAKQTALIEQLTLRKRGLMQQLLTGKKRLKGFEGEWKEVRLGEIGVFFKGGGVPKDSIISAGHKCLTYGDLYTKYDYVIFDVKSYIDDDTANESVKIQYGDICFAGSGETKEDIGKCAAFIDNEYGYAGGDIIVFRANDCNPITLSYILNSSDVIRQKSNMGQGHSVVHIYPYQLEKLLIKLPSKAEQNAIATILMESDKEIEIQKQKLAAMQEQKKGLMQVLLTGKKRIK